MKHSMKKEINKWITKKQKKLLALEELIELRQEINKKANQKLKEKK